MANARDFNGTNQDGDFGAMNDLEGLGALTIALWVWLDSLSDLDGIVFNRQSATQRYGMTLSQTGQGTNNDAHVFMATAMSRSMHTTGDIVTTGVWHHWGLVFDGSLTGNTNRLKFYFDGVQQTLTEIGTGTIGATVPTSTANLILAQNTGTAAFADGRFQEMGIWDIALSSAQMANLGTDKWVPPLVANANLIHHYKFDGLTSPEEDYVGTADCTLANSPGTAAGHSLVYSLTNPNKIIQANQAVKLASLI